MHYWADIGILTPEPQITHPLITNEAHLLGQVVPVFPRWQYGPPIRHSFRGNILLHLFLQPNPSTCPTQVWIDFKCQGQRGANGRVDLIQAESIPRQML